MAQLLAGKSKRFGLNKKLGHGPLDHQWSRGPSTSVEKEPQKGTKMLPDIWREEGGNS